MRLLVRPLWGGMGIAMAAGGLLLAALVCQPTSDAAPQADSYVLTPLVADGYLGVNGNDLIEFAMIPGQPNQAIVARQSGHIYRVALDGSFAPTLWGDVSGDVTFNNEQGLLSVAFSPNFTSDGRVYLYYTPGSPTPTVLARYNATVTDLNESSEHVLLNIEEFAPNHNGGHIAFDSAGLLYLSLGDGGGSGDPNEKGQALNTLLGKVIRIDVSGASGYTIPPSNPFDDEGGPIREEIFAYGFRNPWRMTIDPETDDVWLGDVGQGDWEEVNRVVSGGNYGWDCYEGNHAYELTGCPPANTMEFPRAEYDHDLGVAVTGGVVYRGNAMPELEGWYVYADYYTGRIWAVDTETTGAAVQLIDTTHNISSFTLLPNGEVAVVTYNDGVFQLGNGDSDNDGWSDSMEAYLGTDPNDACGFTAGGDPASETWPPDLAESNSVNIGDVLALKPVFGQAVPPASSRYDLAVSGSINVGDVLALKPDFNKSCTP